MQLSTSTVADFQRDGVVVLRGVFRDWVEPLRAGVAALMADPSSRERSVRPADGAAPFFQDLCNWQRIEPFRSFVLDSPAAPLAAGLMQSATARFFHDHVLVKAPGNSTVTPWHQDQPYYCVNGERSVSFWAPLDPVDRAVALECVASSHLWGGKGFRPMRFDGSRLYADDDFETMPDIDARRDELPIRGWSLEPGDAIAFDFRTVHGAPANTSTRSRRVFSTRWVGDGARFIRRGANGSPAFPHLALEDGAPFDAPEFPLVWPRQAPAGSGSGGLSA
jgi:ectoine hydroxylase-related dioxygenase (phytanoyl-CoA dioxygenase family)